MHATKLIAAIYVRVSTEEQAQEGQSIQAQIEVLTQYCQLFGIQIRKIYKDLGISGKTMNRPGLEELIRDSKNNQFNVVLVWKISRLSRSLKDLLILLDEFEKNGVSFISYSEKFDTSTPVGRMTLQILGSIAEFERNTIIENVKLALGEVARQGRKAGGSVLGYDYHDKKLVVNNEESSTVRIIFDLYVNKNMGIHRIAKWMNENGYRTKRENSFGKDSIGDIISNPVYIGINRHNIGTDKEYSVTGEHEPIIDKDLWDLAQVKRDKNKDISKRRNECGVALLAGLIKCPDCGSSFVTSYHQKKRPDKNGDIKVYRYRYYECNNFTRTRNCYHNRVNAESLEAQVIDRIKKVSTDYEIIEKAILEAERQVAQEVKPANMELTSINKQIAKLKSTKEKYLQLFESGKINDITQIIDRINSIDNEINTYEFKASEYSNIISRADKKYDSKQIRYIFNHFASIIDNLTMNEKKELIQSIVKEVKINADRQIEYVAVSFDMGSGSYRI